MSKSIKGSKVPISQLSLSLIPCPLSTATLVSFNKNSKTYFHQFPAAVSLTWRNFFYLFSSVFPRVVNVWFIVFLPFRKILFAENSARCLYPPLLGRSGKQMILQTTEINYQKLEANIYRGKKPTWAFKKSKEAGTKQSIYSQIAMQMTWFSPLSSHCLWQQ